MGRYFEFGHEVWVSLGNHHIKISDGEAKDERRGGDTESGRSEKSKGTGAEA